MAKIDRWLDMCSTHEICKQWQRATNAGSNQLPKRLIEITSDNNTPRLRLVLTDEVPSLEITYATLSHCWGFHPFTSLSSRNMDHFRANIAWKDFTLTFQEAIITVARLGMQYIWIDALCIIQDSHEDWSIEAKKMATVYSNSSLNITADASMSGDEELFRERDPDTISPSLVQHGDSRIMCYRDFLQWDVAGSCLNQRAWVVQERFLAPRNIRFGQHEVHFECFVMAATESLPDGYDVVDPYQPGLTIKRRPRDLH